MKYFLIAIKWIFYLLAAMLLGILLAMPGATWNHRMKGIEAGTGGYAYPTVGYSSMDYRASDYLVPEFSRWSTGQLCQNFERRYPPSQITPALQHSFYERLTAAALAHGELPAVIRGCSLQAVLEANFDEKQASNDPAHASPATLLIYAERAEYFGQDCWCFLCLSTADHENGTARVIVATCTPDYGLLHVQKIGSY